MLQFHGENDPRLRYYICGSNILEDFMIKFYIEHIGGLKYE